MRITKLHFDRAGQLYGSSDTVIAWDPTSGRELYRLADMRRHYGPVVLSPDEKLLAHSDRDGTIRLFDARAGKEVGVLRGHQNWCYPLIFTPDSRFLVSGSYDSTVRVWEIASGKECHRLLGHRGGLSSLAVSADGHRLASSASDGAGGDYDVRLWDLRTGKEERRFKPGRGSVFAVAFSPDGRWLAGVGGLPGRLNDRGDVQVWEVGSGLERRSMKGHRERVTCVTFSPDGRMLATGSIDKTARLWEVATGKERQPFRHESTIESLAFSPDGKRLAASSSDAPVYIWDVAGLLKARKLSQEQAEKAWAELASADAPAAFGALRRLAGDPERAVPLLREHLQKVKPVDEKELERLVQQLDSPCFAERQQAAQELEKQADAAADELRQALKKSTAPETRKTLQEILDQLDTPPPDVLRGIRAVEALEWMATPEAARCLETLAKGASGARLTREAVAALERRKERP